MIVTIAGTSGAGKTYLMRQFLDWAVKQKRAKMVPQYVAARNLPIGYNLVFPKLREPVFLAGAYEGVNTSGCDTIKDISKVFDLIRERHEYGPVIYEGLIVMNHTRGPQLVEELGTDFYILHLNIPFTACMAAVNARRAELGKGPILQKHNIKNNYIRAANYCTKMKAVGATVMKVTRDDALPAFTHIVEGWWR